MVRRRDFLKSMAALTAGVALPLHAGAPTRDRLGELLPRRLLGRTGVPVTMLGAGGHHLGATTDRDCQEAIEAALEGGIRFFDTAENYSAGRSESRLGQYLTPKYRDLVFLMTKTNAEDAQAARGHLEGSLKRLDTDYLDLWQIHGVGRPADVDSCLAGGVLEVLMEAQAAGKVKYLGFTGHEDPAGFGRILEATRESDNFDACQMPINVLDPSYHSFIETVIPQAGSRKIGLLAMKTLAGGRFFDTSKEGKKVTAGTAETVIPGRVSLEEALSFVWSLPVSVLITGAENADLLREKIALARRFASLDQKERDALVEKVADMAVGGKVEFYKSV